MTPEFDISVITPEYEVYKDDSSEPVQTPELDTVVDVNGYDPEGYY
jgi:hypothetical protein